jgi:hypothetical protein
MSSTNNENSDGLRVLGFPMLKADKNRVRFSAKNVFAIGDIVVVPRSNEKLSYARVLVVDSKSDVVKIRVKENLVKSLPSILLGTLLDAGSSSDPRTISKR